MTIGEFDVEYNLYSSYRERKVSNTLSTVLWLHRGEIAY